MLFMSHSLYLNRDLQSVMITNSVVYPGNVFLQKFISVIFQLFKESWRETKDKFTGET